MKKIDLSTVAVECTRRAIRHRSMGPATARLASAYWTNFAKAGNPNGNALPRWPSFDEHDETALQPSHPGVRTARGANVLRRVLGLRPGPRPALVPFPWRVVVCRRPADRSFDADEQR